MEAHLPVKKNEAADNDQVTDQQDGLAMIPFKELLGTGYRPLLHFRDRFAPGNHEILGFGKPERVLPAEFLPNFRFA